MATKTTSSTILVASRGGHWVQLMLAEELLGNAVIKVSTHGNSEADFTIADFSRTNIYKAPISAWQSYKILRDVRPRWVVSTGAAPGLLFLFIAKLTGKNTIWIDSMANTKKISLSGRLASYFCNICLTQWEELANQKVQYHGRLL
ncbi:hypothetical protein [Aliiglaciecola sp. LCG003]|uniref:hypothetical protein n=1 Tax=Aliiglaciecola sp. LCG003 TaxID=3053655 RepID=UPI0025747D58|nr:hypothetical protein [Aliiglaciecola sp. LCG003]WJG09742.1 hypothetical protein QR722_01505 [Aliiglaciecola sp. LCG003]